jgi:hypothetical protein
MANTTRVTVGSQVASVPIPLSTYADPFNVGLGVKISAGASLTYTVEHTYDDVQAASFTPATAVWYSNTNITAQVANKDGNYTSPVTAVRLNVTAWVSGTATLTVIQAGY